jgi:hypothetical protein
MTIDQSTTTGDAARASLEHLMARVGVDGLVAAINSPGLLAAVDQHAAAVRDVVGDVPDITALADYARVVHSAAVRRGQALPDIARLDWTRAPAYLLRLLAVCALVTGLA